MLDMRTKCDNLQENIRLFSSSRLTTWVTTSPTRGRLRRDAPCVTRNSAHSQLWRSVRGSLVIISIVFERDFPRLHLISRENHFTCSEGRFSISEIFLLEVESDAFFSPTGEWIPTGGYWHLHSAAHPLCHSVLWTPAEAPVSEEQAQAVHLQPGTHLTCHGKSNGEAEWID